MIRDQQNMFSRSQAITADAISEHVIDLEPNGGPNLTKNIGAGNPLYLHILVMTTLTDADGTPTLTVTLESDDNTTLSSATVHATVATAVTEATLVAGYWIAQGYALPAGNYQRYLGLRYTTNTADFDGGTVSAWLSENRYDSTTYESAITTGIN
jgi:hypothetical protein